MIGPSGERPGRRLHRSVMWRYLRETGLESCGLWEYREPGGAAPVGWAVRGTAVTAYQGVPTEVRYRVVCDSDSAEGGPSR